MWPTVLKLCFNLSFSLDGRCEVAGNVHWRAAPHCFFSLLPGDCSWKLSLFKQTALLNSVNLTWLTLLFVLPAKISLCQIQSVSTGLCNSLLMWRSQSEQPMLNYKPITLIVYLNQRQMFYISIKLFLSLLNTAERGAKLIKPNFPWD